MPTPTTSSPPATPLAALTTLRLGGPAGRLVRAGSADEIVAAVRAGDAAGERVLVVGGGSNLVVGDDGLDGTVVHLESRGHTVERHDGEALVRVEAGQDWDELVAATVDEGLGGLECLSGIPGCAGATPVQNVGAYGVEVADLLVDATLLDRRTGDVGTVPAADLGLGYRTSRLKSTDREIVLAARFRMTTDGLSAPVRYAELARALDVEPGVRAPLAAVREAVLGLRRGKGMVLDEADHDTWSAGSFFTNPVVHGDVAERVAARVAATDQRPVTAWPTVDGRVKLSAAALIERAGVPRGYPGSDSPVRVSTRHTLALTHRGGGTTAQLLALARDVRDRVETAFGVRLVPEPVLVGCALD
ncbi:UDP-N-acetylmuramate dehydrogenase [Actinomycetospora endophytica]|uniref:UDP-N-acetylenolpyruvoylglucosamine reductase n=1 Tax=Actinomycetospora endophytica TaxID=2291215 RepID=A0ABS8P5P3_9PSEU|nr:UDP-N-acetylmuramate dehydrogenase [Actinomycetospora endophytica]MCD2192716.1 UDP-N-acetylmuramate dehydrogenase [Actinomycetospora endophytica]